ncbi:MAG TPA: molybdopterin-dependent oxidoreductase [Patescibacteria group bacterium]|nr:molybdopterin-dependent oxidoreductase [Patescibacteria group bacterium]
MEKILCGKCGEPFIHRRVFNRFLEVAKEKNLIEFQDLLMLCPRCRTLNLAQKLVGNNLEWRVRSKFASKRRREKINPIKKDGRTGATVYKTECFICNSGCDATAYVKDGKVVKVEGDLSSPVTKGTLCAKGLASRSILYHSARLKHPIMRLVDRGGCKWKRISWNDALNAVVKGFGEVEKKYGRQSIALATGTSRGWLRFFNRFANAFGCQFTGPGTAQCALPRQTSSLLVLGSHAMECPDYDHTRCMLIWGVNPPATWPVKALGMMAAKARGARLIVVDPIFTETASKADLWLQVRPGTDAALTLGMLNVVIKEELYDKDFVDKWCVGFEELRERVQRYPPARVAEITWVPEEQIIEASKKYATTKPACVTQALAIDQNADTISTSRAIAMLSAITGNIDVPGGNIPLMPTGVIPASAPELTLRDRLSKESHEKRLGSRDYPLLAGEWCMQNPTAHNATLWKAILTGEPYPVRALYCQGSNMLLCYANAKMVESALLSLDFFVVVDLFMTPTAELADIVLPAACWLEREAVTYQHHVSFSNVHLQQKVAEIKECWTDIKILNELAKRLSVGELMFNSDEEYFDFLLRPRGITFKEFKRLGMLSVPYKYRKYEKENFKTQSGKVELYSRRLEDLGFDPLPSYREPSESPFSTPDLAKNTLSYSRLAGGNLFSDTQSYVTYRYYWR